MSLAPGARIGSYEVISMLGAGGMGEVYRAEDTRLARPVAIKLLSPQFTADHEFQKRFEREARLIAALDHPNICPVYDVGEHEGSRYLVMALLEGETLAASTSTWTADTRRRVETWRQPLARAPRGASSGCPTSRRQARQRARWARAASSCSTSVWRSSNLWAAAEDALRQILRGTMKKIAEGEPWTMLATIDDPAMLDEIASALKEMGRGFQGHGPVERCGSECLLAHLGYHSGHQARSNINFEES